MPVKVHNVSSLESSFLEQ